MVVASDRMRPLMTNLSHAASFHANERIAPGNRGIKHLVLVVQNHAAENCISYRLPDGIAWIDGGKP